MTNKSDMLPGFPLNNVQNNIGMTLKFGSKFFSILTFNVILSNVKNIFSSKTTRAIQLAWSRYVSTFLVSISRIISSSSYKQMIRINTSRIVTVMTNKISLRDCSSTHKNTKLMSSNVSSVIPKSTIPVTIVISRVTPASLCFSNLGFKSFNIIRIHKNIITCH